MQLILVMEELLQFLPWNAALSKLAQIPLDMGLLLLFCSHGALYNPFLLLFNRISLCVCVTGGEQAASMFT